MPPTLDDEWLEGDNRTVEQRLEDCVAMPHTYRVPTRELVIEAAGEIRALRLLVKNFSDRIDELQVELHGLGAEDFL